MNYLSFDYLIVYVSLFVTLLIGLRAGRGIKDIQEYALANKMYGTIALILTFLATDVGGQGVINIAGEVGNTGIIMAIALLGAPIMFVLQGLFIIPNIVHFRGCITMGDVMGTLYGENSKIITGILGFFTTICIVGMELTVLGIVCESLIGIDHRWGIAVGGTLLAAYTAYGGIKSVTATDVFQFLVLILILPIITGTALKCAGGTKAVFLTIPSEKFQIVSHPNFSYYLTLFLSFSVFQFNIIDPAPMQRFLMGKTKRQLQKQCFALAGFYVVLLASLSLIGLSGLVLYPTLEPTSVVTQIITDLLPTGVKGVAITGVFMAMVSTIDSYLHSAGLTLVHDVIKPACDKAKVNIDELCWVRYVTFVIGLMSISAAFLHADDLYGFIFTSFEFTGPLLVFPLLAGIVGLKPEKQAFYVASGMTIVAFLASRLFLPAAESHLTPLISVVTNGVLFFGMHFVRNNDFVFVNHGESAA